ncbi:MAG: ATP-binding protein [Proteobacteria bacterium]|nr:ATP-binding protein [Pseudomonadota bacterium]MBU1582038.1 ATP-binding protein [Pseudomonadota bacterium]MBU2454416.1 ATP-binding protein [Pseudomonadota bacterium]MBU2630468.1 ATP-binding protein [Pseudomonadota bacterium]
MKRNIDSKLVEWKKSDFRKPLVIRGARQVGKTYSVCEFGENYFETFIKLDFERDRTSHRIFDGDLTTQKLIVELEVHANKRITPGKTLLFFDEIQECERALLSLRYFYEEIPELHIIAAGSMLEFTLGSVSLPVGRLSFEWMRPMTFHEVLSASGNKILADKLPCFSNFRPVSETIHLKIIEQLKLYFLTGGMPESVKRYCRTRTLIQSFAAHEDIYQSYLQSLVNYNKRADIDSLDHLMRSVPSRVGSQIKYTRLDPDRRIEKTKTSLSILERSLLFHIVKSSDASGLPLNATASSKVMKPIFLDVGLMQYVCGLQPSDILKEKDLSNVYRGALAEQFVGQEMLAAGGSENFNLFYWSRAKKSSSAEVDYLYVKNGSILPIEVKSGPAGKLKSLHIFLNEHPTIEKGYVMSPVSFDRQEVDRFTFIPIYTRFV